MGKKAEQFLEEVNTNKKSNTKSNQIISKKKNKIEKIQNKELSKSKRKLLSQLIGYSIIIIGIIFTIYRYYIKEITQSSAITMIILSLFFGGIFILIGRHYG